jgi:hypothetical protein
MLLGYNDIRSCFLVMLGENQVEHVIIPMPHEHFVILAPNVIIIFFSAFLIGFYIHQGVIIRQRIDEARLDFNEIHSTSSLPNMISNSYRRSLSKRTKSLMSF